MLYFEDIVYLSTVYHGINFFVLIRELLLQFGSAEENYP